MKIDIRFNGGTRSGQQQILDAKPLIRIGRRADNDVVFDPYKDLDVSGHHAELRQEADGYYLYDLGSSNGTFVGGQKVTRVRVDNGLEVCFGPTGPRMLITYTDQPALVSGPQVAVPPGQAPAAMASGPQAQVGPKVGQRTVAMMIDSALKQSREGSSKGKGSPTMFMRSMVNQAVKRSTVKFKIITGVLLFLLIGAVGFQFAYPYIFPDAVKPVINKKAQKKLLASQKELRDKVDELEELTEALEKYKDSSEKNKKKTLKEIERLNLKLAAEKGGGSGKVIVKNTYKGIYVIATTSRKGARGYCTAFAVHKRVAATNAHCIKALERYAGRGQGSYLVMNQHPKNQYKIVQHVAHPGYHKPIKKISPDVGLLKVNKDMPVILSLANAEVLRELGAGDVMYTYGFPGRLADVSSPMATFGQGVIGRITRLNGKIGKFSQSVLVQHSAFTSGGTSGSPIFNATGKVVAINAGGYREPGSEVVKDILTGRRRMMMVGKTLTGYNFSIRIDVLKVLLDDFGE